MMHFSWRLIAIITILATALLIILPDGRTSMRAFDIPTLGSAYRAKELCSCLYVIGQDPAYCESWTYEPSLGAKADIEDAERVVTAYYTWLGENFRLYERRARWIDERRGCRLLPTF